MFPKRVNYRFFTDDEISKISVLELKSPVSFDRLGHPVPQGLYDTRLGPTEPGQTYVFLSNSLSQSLGLKYEIHVISITHVLLIYVYQSFMYRLFIYHTS